MLNWPNVEEAAYLKNFPELAAEIRALFQAIPRLSPDERMRLAATSRRTVRLHRERSRGTDDPADGTVQEVPEYKSGQTVCFSDEFRISGEVGEGGQKRVFRAVQSSTGQDAAIKQNSLSSTF